MTTPAQTVAVTGASGYIGACLLRHLEEKEEINKFVAIDSRPLPLPFHNVVAYRRDVTQPIDDALLDHQVSTVVHLALDNPLVRSQREVHLVQETNINALTSVLESCVRSGVKHVVFLSSHTVYGVRPDNPIPLTVGSPLRPQVDFHYGYGKYLSEQILQEFAEHQADIKVTILRTCLVLGPAGGNYMAQSFFKSWFLAVENQNPPLQFVYEDDLARVVDIVIQRGIEGVFNVAGDGVVFYREMAESIGSRIVSIPSSVASAVLRLSWNLGFQRKTNAPVFDMARYPVVVSTGTLKQATGYRFWHTSMDALKAYAGSNLLNNDWDQSPR